MQDTSPSLPSFEEVLICSSDTTPEEVSIFDLQMDRNNLYLLLAEFSVRTVNYGPSKNEDP